MEIRSAKGLTASGRRVCGYAAVFGQAADIGGFTEIVRKGAFADTLSRPEANILALYHHDTRALLGTTQAGTLKLREDDKGLAFELDLPDTGYGNDVAELVRRGDVAGCSFGFNVQSERWSGNTRELLAVELVEITLTAKPAYPQTSVSLRSLHPRRLFLETL